MLRRYSIHRYPREHSKTRAGDGPQLVVRRSYSATQDQAEEEESDAEEAVRHNGGHEGPWGWLLKLQGCRLRGNRSPRAQLMSLLGRDALDPVDGALSGATRVGGLEVLAQRLVLGVVAKLDRSGVDEPPSLAGRGHQRRRRRGKLS